MPTELNGRSPTLTRWDGRGAIIGNSGWHRFTLHHTHERITFAIAVRMFGIQNFCRSSIHTVSRFPCPNLSWCACITFLVISCFRFRIIGNFWSKGISSEAASRPLIRITPFASRCGLNLNSVLDLSIFSGFLPSFGLKFAVNALISSGKLSNCACFQRMFSAC